MKAKDKDVASLPETIKETKPVDQSRRSFAKVGAAVVPVVMTLANRSAWGAGSQLCDANQSLAGIQSYQAVANQSHYASNVANNSWKTPEQWVAAINGDTTYQTLIDALTSGGINSYNTASALNLKYYPPFPVVLVDNGNVTLLDYQTFYENPNGPCAAGDNSLPTGFDGLAALSPTSAKRRKK